MKKQIIIVAAVALVTVLLFTSYAIFFDREEIASVSDDPLYSLTDDITNALSEIKDKVVITVSGYNADNTDWTVIYRYSEALAKTNKKIKLVNDSLGFDGVRISSDGNTKDFDFDEFFVERYDGVYYGFNGEMLLVNSILSLCGKSELDLSMKALSGFDTDGDNVTGSGAPFLFPSIERSSIEYLSIKNKNDEYQLIQHEGEFYFGDSMAVEYDSEMFSLVTTNCRYAVSNGKMALPEGRSWSDYGITNEGGSTASYSLLTSVDGKGNHYIHTVYIGDLASTGSYYYARYLGMMFKGEEEINISKDNVYFIPVSSVDESIALPQTAMMSPAIINPIGSTEALTKIDNIVIEDYTNNITVITKNMADYNPAPNLSAIDSTAVSKLLSDKTQVSNYANFSDGWNNHIDVFAAFSSSDGKATYVEAALARKDSSGKYKIEFGILRDEANKAYTPAKIRFTKSYDGINWESCGEVSISQSDKTVARYEYSFEDSVNIKFIRVHFDVPQIAQSYIVFDEIRIFVGDKDSQPYSAIGGIWKLTSPSALIASDRNYSYLDMTNFGDFVQSFAALEGEKVVGFGFSKDGDASIIDNAVLKEFGLDTPDKRYAFDYDGVTTELFVSKPNEEGKYYAYSKFSGVVDGESLCVTTDVIVELSLSTAKWLAWDMTEYIDHSLLSIYLVDISEMTITSDGKEHTFYISVGDNDDVSDVKYNGESYDVKSFKYLYESLVAIYMQDKYIEGETEKGEEYFRISIESETYSPEIIFYRVSSTKCYYTIDGEGGYYVFVEDVNKAIDKLNTYISGGILSSDLVVS